jgi:hypothetical protein
MRSSRGKSLGEQARRGSRVGLDGLRLRERTSGSVREPGLSCFSLSVTNVDGAPANKQCSMRSMGHSEWAHGAHGSRVQALRLTVGTEKAAQTTLPTCQQQPVKEEQLNVMKSYGSDVV